MKIKTKASLFINPSENSAVITKEIVLFTRTTLITSIKSLYPDSVKDFNDSSILGSYGVTSVKL
jgi:hypothetical protein